MGEIAVGIDLGTTNSCVAAVVGGQPVVITNEAGERTHASVVSFLENNRVVVGNEAKRQILRNPENTVYSAKRLIGRFSFSEEVRKAQMVCPYKIVEGPNHGVRIQARDKQFSLPEISAMVLVELKRMAEAMLGQSVTKAVITVPAYFNDNQRQATRDAGLIAGMEVLRIINEPTAAALAVGFGKDMSARLAVYDLGGGTFDVSILEVGKDVFEVLSTAGDTYLGGDDFDILLADYLAGVFQAQTKIDVRGDKLAMGILREGAELAKKTMSVMEVAEIECSGLTKGPDGRPIDFNYTLKRPDFDRMIMSLIQRTFKVCDEAMQSAHLSVGDLDGIILVGGPTRLQSLRSAVRHYFRQDPIASVDPDEVVAIGAAIQAHNLLNQQQSSFLLDVTPLSLRLATVSGYSEKIIEKNTPVPIEQRRAFTTTRDFQDKVMIRVLQGESKLTNECEMLGEFVFSGFRVAPRGEVTIEVCFEIDANGIVNVSAHDVETGTRAGMQLNLSAQLTEQEIATSRSRIPDLEIAARQ